MNTNSTYSPELQAPLDLKNSQKLASLDVTERALTDARRRHMLMVSDREDAIARMAELREEIDRIDAEVALNETFQHTLITEIDQLKALVG